MDTKWKLQRAVINRENLIRELISGDIESEIEYFAERYYDNLGVNAFL